MKKCLFALIALLTPLVANADAVEIDGIYYNLIKKVKTAEVTQNPHNYSGNITIPKKVTYEDVEYSVTTIGQYAFHCNYYLTSLVIPNSVTDIGFMALAYCLRLTSVNIPNSVTSIGGSAFEGCESLTSLDIPNSVTSIGTNGFNGCTSITSLNIPNSVTSIGSGVLANCSGLTSFTIPTNWTSIPSSTFLNCSNLTSISIPNNVTSIEIYAFKGCNELTSITIGNGVENINNEAFALCPNLTDVYCISENVPYNYTDIFDGSYIDHATLHVPSGSVEAYQATEPWSNFNRIIDYDEVSISANNIRTSSSIFDLDFTNVTGLKAYIVSGFSPSTCTLVLTPATTIPAGEGLLLKGEEGTYVIPHTTTDMVYSNLLVGVPTTTYVYPTDGEYTNFILANGIHGINFYTLSEAGNIAGGKAYLQLPTSEIPVNSSPLQLSFTDEEITGINTVQNETNSRLDFYDLQGRKVKSPVKGLYVVNGKKVIIK